MPYRKTNFYENGFYHVYNRGVEKRNIFQDESDYEAFISILKAYLIPPKNPSSSLPGQALRIKDHQLFNEITFNAYCLMPNHFHLLVQQRLPSSITNFMRRALTTYSMYFNEKYSRVGSLFQGRFKAKEIESDEYILHLSRYIHRNPLELPLVRGINELQIYSWSSYPAYLGREENRWIDRGFILGFFPKNQAEGYKKFVEYETSFEVPEALLFDD